MPAACVADEQSHAERQADAQLTGKRVRCEQSDTDARPEQVPCTGATSHACSTAHRGSKNESEVAELTHAGSRHEQSLCERSAPERCQPAASRPKVSCSTVERDLLLQAAKTRHRCLHFCLALEYRLCVAALPAFKRSVGAACLALVIVMQQGSHLACCALLA